MAKLEISVEKTPSQKLSSFILKNVFSVNITHLPGTDFSKTVDAIKSVNDKAGRQVGIPHLAARNFINSLELANGLKALEGEISEVLIIGGSNPVGQAFNYADDVLTFINNEGYDLNSWCAVHPQLEKYEEVLKTKYKSKYVGGYNQLCLSPVLLSKWRSQTRICIPTATSVSGLKKYMELCGITGSFNYLLGNLNGILYLTSNGFDTKRFVKDINKFNSNRKQFHLYNFGKLDYTLGRLLDI